MLETRITKVYPRPVGWVVVLLVLLVDLEPKTWHISEKNQNAENIMDGQLKKRLIKRELTCHHSSLPWQRKDCQQVQETAGRTAAEGCTGPEIKKAFQNMWKTVSATTSVVSSTKLGKSSGSSVKENPVPTGLSTYNTL